MRKAVSEKVLATVGMTATVIVFAIFFASLVLKGVFYQFWLPTLAGIALGVLGIGIYAVDKKYLRR